MSELPDHDAAARPASLFERERHPAPEIGGRTLLEGHSALGLPMAARVVLVEFASALASLEGVATLRLRLIPRAADALRVECFFRDVKELRLPRLPAEGFDVAQFSIEDARHCGWTGVHWLVGDAASDAFAFYAASATITAVTRES